MPALLKKSAMIALLSAVAGFFSSGCGQRGSLYLPIVPSQNAIPVTSEQSVEQGHVTAPPGLQPREGSLSPAPAQALNYTGIPTVDVMGAPIFFEPLPERGSSPVIPPDTSSL